MITASRLILIHFQISTTLLNSRRLLLVQVVQSQLVIVAWWIRSAQIYLLIIIIIIIRLLFLYNELALVCHISVGAKKLIKSLWLVLLIVAFISTVIWCEMVTNTLLLIMMNFWCIECLLLLSLLMLILRLHLIRIRSDIDPCCILW